MNWLDVAGCPGAGKSTICYPVWGDKEVTADGKPPPAYWRPFLDEVAVLMRLVADHPTYPAVVRMNARSIGKMSAVERMEPPAGKFPVFVQKFPVFVQTGLVQRILGFGWRLHEMGRDPYLIATALWRMPVSAGVAFLEADLDTLLARNRARETVAATAHENRSHQVPHMLAVIPIAKQVLRARGIPVATIDVQHQSIDDARAQLLAFAAAASGDVAAVGPRSQVATLSSSA